MSTAALETLFKRDRVIVSGALCALILLSWIALLAGAGTGMDPAAMSGWWIPTVTPSSGALWTPTYWVVAFFMWAVMMVAMMLPSASPMVLLYARVVRQAEDGRARKASASIAAFASGYLTLWILFSALAVIVQNVLERTAALSAMMSSRSVLLSGMLLVAAGLYQFTPLKAACLSHCRGPAAFIAAHWRPGVAGGWRMGLLHGAYCVGCCAVLMLLLFVGGVMNLVWIAGLTLIIAIEKLTPFGAVTARVLAGVLVAGGVALLILDVMPA